MILVGSIIGHMILIGFPITSRLSAYDNNAILICIDFPKVVTNGHDEGSESDQMRSLATLKSIYVRQ